MHVCREVTAWTIHSAVIDQDRTDTRCPLHFGTVCLLGTGCTCVPTPSGCRHRCISVPGSRRRRHRCYVKSLSISTVASPLTYAHASMRAQGRKVPPSCDRQAIDPIFKHVVTDLEVCPPLTRRSARVVSVDVAMARTTVVGACNLQGGNGPQG